MKRFIPLLALLASGCSLFGGVSVRGDAGDAAGEDKGQAKSQRAGGGSASEEQSATPASAVKGRADVFAQSVLKRFPDAKMEDSLSLDKVSAQLEKIDTAMLVKLKTGKDADWAPTTREDLGRGFDPGGNRTDCKDDYLASQGVWVQEDRTPGGLHLKLSLCQKQKSYESVEPGTVGVIWGKNASNYVVFVTLDGGRYRIDPADVSPETVDPTTLPDKPTIQHALVKFGDANPENTDEQIATLRKQSAELGEKFNACANKIWDAATRKFEANAGILSSAARERANDQAEDAAWKQTESQCGATRKKYVQAYTEFGQQRSERRAKLHEVVVARLKTGGSLAAK